MRAKTISWRWDSDSHTFREEDSVPISDRGFRYGMMVFETVRILGGVPAFAEEHLERLRLGALAAGFGDEPVPHEEILAFLRNGRFPDGVARVFITAGDGPPDAPVTDSRCLILSEAREPVPQTVYDAGYRLMASPDPFHPVLAGIKTGNYWTNTQALQKARRSGCDEALLFNATGELVSASMANVFVQTGGRLVTPPVSCGGRAGVVRDWAQTCRAVEEAPLAIDDLRSADEIFLTSSWIGIMPATTFESALLPSRSTAAALRREYENQSSG